MQPIRNRYFGWEAKQILPWGDPYILQLFELLERLENRSEATSAAAYSAQHLRVSGSAGNDPEPRFDRSRGARGNATQGDSMKDE